MASYRNARARCWLACVTVMTLTLLAACSGPDQFGDTLPTSTPIATMTPTQPSALEVEPTATEAASPTTEPTSEPTATEEPEPQSTPTATAEPTPEPEPTATAEPTATPQPVAASDTLPNLDELSEGYTVANQGDRTADQLAQAYVDPAAHAARLEEWGFQQHVFREFTRNDGGPENNLPTYLLATVNVYGSPEQADLAVQWLEDLQVSQGAVVLDPPPIGETALAMTQRTSTNEDAAWVVFRHTDRIYIYYAQGNNPLPEAIAVATRIYERLTGSPETV